MRATLFLNQFMFVVHLPRAPLILDRNYAPLMRRSRLERRVRPIPPRVDAHGSSQPQAAHGAPQARSKVGVSTSWTTRLVICTDTCENHLPSSTARMDKLKVSREIVPMDTY